MSQNVCTRSIPSNFKIGIDGVKYSLVHVHVSDSLLSHQMPSKISSDGVRTLYIQINDH